MVGNTTLALDDVLASSKLSSSDRDLAMTLFTRAMVSLLSSTKRRLPTESDTSVDGLEGSNDPSPSSSSMAMIQSSSSGLRSSSRGGGEELS